MRMMGLNNVKNNAVQEENFLSKDERQKISFLLERAKCDRFTWEPSDEEVKRSGFSNIREYIAAYYLLTCLEKKSLTNYQVKKKNASLFILEHTNDIEVAKYLTVNGEFLFCEAIKDNFELPCCLPDESLKREYEFCEIMHKLVQYDLPLSIKIWKWCLKTFTPYSEYDNKVYHELCYKVLDKNYLYEENFIEAFMKEFEKDEDFYNINLKSFFMYEYFFAMLFVTAIEKQCYKTAYNMFRDFLNIINGNWKDIIDFIDNIIKYASNDDLVVMEYFKNNIFPIVKEINIGMVQDEIKNWEKKIDDYILDVEMYNPKYSHSRRNSWRNNVPDGKKYGINSLCFEYEEDYMDAYNVEEKIDKKFNISKYNDIANYLFCSLTHSEHLFKLVNYFDDRYIKIDDLEKKVNKIIEKRTQWQNIYLRECEDSNDIVVLYGVVFGHCNQIYIYNAKQDYRVGEKVIVPFMDKVKTGLIVLKGEYRKDATPYPVEKIKFIIGKEE